MPWIQYNPNPSNKQTIDCVVRAISIAEGESWEEVHKKLSDKARAEADMPSVNPVWADYLKELGYHLVGLPNTCPRCYTVSDFATDYDHGTYVLGTGDHAVAVIDGNYIDTWDSGNEVPMYFFMKPLTKGAKHYEPSEHVQRKQSTSDSTNQFGNTTDTSSGTTDNGVVQSQWIPGSPDIPVKQP